MPSSIIDRRSGAAVSASTDVFNGALTSVAVKAPVRVQTTANITLSGEQTINSVAVVDGDRVLVKDQTDQTENGIYIVSTGTWARSPDFDSQRDVRKGTMVLVEDGTIYRCTTANTIDIGTDNITFALVGTIGDPALDTYVNDLIADALTAAVTNNTETGVSIVYNAVDGTFDFVIDDEYIQDLVGAMVGGSETGITVTYNDTNGTLTFALSDEYIQDLIGNMFINNVEFGLDATYNDTDGEIDLNLAIPAGVMYRSATQGLITTEAKIQFNATDVSALSRGSFDTSTNYRYTMGSTGGRVLVIVRAEATDLDSGDEVTLTLKRNGTIVGIDKLRNDSGSGPYIRTLTIVKVLTLAANEYLEAYVTADVDGVTLAAGLDSTSMEIVELS